MQDESTGHVFLSAARTQIERSAATIEHCLNQITDAQLWWRPTPSQNSIGNLIRHLCGNVRQWIISGVRGVPDTRDRPAEFLDGNHVSRQELLADLKQCVEEAGRSLRATEDPDLLSPRRIQGFDTNVLCAIMDSTAHFQGHTQEIISLTRLQLGDAYKFSFTPSTPEEGAAVSD